MVGCCKSLLAGAILFAMALLASATVDAAPPNNCDRCFALVQANGKVLKHRYAGTVYKNGPGGYLVVFTYSINRCALSANIDSLIAEQNVRLAFISISRANNVAVWVDIYGPPSGGSVRPVDFPFSIVATC